MCPRKVAHPQITRAAVCLVALCDVDTQAVLHRKSTLTFFAAM